MQMGSCDCGEWSNESSGDVDSIFVERSKFCCGVERSKEDRYVMMKRAIFTHHHSDPVLSTQLFQQ
jgi:hypothetical protein